MISGGQNGNESTQMIWNFWLNNIIRNLDLEVFHQGPCLWETDCGKKSAAFTFVGYTDQRLGAAHSKPWSKSVMLKYFFWGFLKWQPCIFPVMVFWLLWAIYLGFSQCLLFILPNK